MQSFATCNNMFEKRNESEIFSPYRIVVNIATYELHGIFPNIVKVFQNIIF